MYCITHLTRADEMQNVAVKELLERAELQFAIRDLRNVLSMDMMKKFDPILTKPLKSLVYTSFDGDNMHYLDWMCYVAHKLGFVPVNPEAALGYYLSTMSHNGKKIEVMRDCIALELACKELWIFDSSSSIKKANLPEGVVAEFVLWNQIRPTLPVRFFPYLQASLLVDLKDSLDEKEPEQILSQTWLTLESQKEFFAKMDPIAIGEIEKKLLLSVKGEQVRPLAYISQDFFDLKHVDWARALAYKSGYVPFSPETIINQFVANVAYRENLSEEYLTDRISLLSVAQELWVFSKPSESLFPSTPLSESVSLDLYYWLTYKSKSPIRFFSWRDANVPKFVPNNLWALTTQEQMENVHA
jgi:hypothetical protein